MQVPFRQTGRTVLVGSCLVILLIVLGALQYSWIDRVGEVESERRQNQLLEAARRLSRDFDSELTRLQFFFQRLAMQRPDLEAGIRTSYQRWKEDQAYGALLKEIWRVQVGDQTAGLSRPSLFEPISGFFQERDWPGHLASIRTRLETAFPSASFFSERGFRPFDGEVPAVLIPDLSPGGRGRRARNFRPSSILILVLDKQFISDIFLPELAARNFGTETSNEFRLWVTDRASQTVYLEWPDSHDQALPNRPDVRQPLFAFRNPRDFPPGPGGPPGGAPQSKSSPPRAPSGTDPWPRK